MVDIVDRFVLWWLEDLRTTLPSAFTADLLPWLTISWVFRLPEKFTKLTQIAELECDKTFPLKAEPFPIPKPIISGHSLTSS